MNTYFTKTFQFSILTWLVIILVIILIRTMIASVVDKYVLAALGYRGYTESVDGKVYSHVTVITFFFTIFFGCVIGTAISFGYTALFPKKM